MLRYFGDNRPQPAPCFEALAPSWRRPIPAPLTPVAPGHVWHGGGGGRAGLAPPYCSGGFIRYPAPDGSPIFPSHLIGCGESRVGRIRCIFRDHPTSAEELGLIDELAAEDDASQMGELKKTGFPKDTAKDESADCLGGRKARAGVTVGYCGTGH